MKYLAEKTLFLIIGHKIIKYERVGTKEDCVDYLFLDNDTTLQLVNKRNFVGINEMMLVGKTIIKIEEKLNRYIRFFLGEKESVELDMTKNGFDTPEAIIVSHGDYLDVVRVDN
ncbi:hypothetical protein Dip510_000788 [Elusimicrobium posterum]|uniref:hypothetical protein n=1 Tax=Elusimicrobium posterum TaxID=3116653 RepID=UPI003C77FEB8